MREGSHRPEARAVLLKYGRVGSNGIPRTCTPGRRLDDGPWASRVIFDNILAAEQAAIELAAIYGGKPQRAYPCPRSRHGHCHLTSEENYARRRPRHPRRNPGHVSRTDAV